jgi:hypothetical protein
MLYDPKWATKEVTVRGLVAWLEQKPADECYDYGNSSTCLAAQFLRQAGVNEERFVGKSGFTLDEEFFREFRFIAAGYGAKRTWTFGAALQRAHAVMSEDRNPRT